MGGRSGGKRHFSCLLHGWILYSIGIPIPSFHLVSSFPGILIFSVFLSRRIFSCLIRLRPSLGPNEGRPVDAIGLDIGI